MSSFLSGNQLERKHQQFAAISLQPLVLTVLVFITAYLCRFDMIGIQYEHAYFNFVSR